jgi:hypothetical protein
MEGHDPMTFSVEADNDAEALTEMTKELMPHASEFHPNLADKTPEELNEMITSKWEKTDETAM